MKSRQGDADEIAVHELIGAIYDAALQPERWPDALVRLSDLTCSVGSMFIYLDRAHPERSQVQCGRLDPESVQRSLTRDELRSPWTDIAERMPPGAAYASDAFVPAAELVKTAHYAEILRPQGILHAGAAALVQDVERAVGFAVYRTREVGPVGSAELRLMSTLVPHFKRASQIAWRLGTLAVLNSAKAAVLDKLDHGVVLLDRRGRVLFVNHAAEALVALRDGVTLTLEGIQAATSTGTTRLRRLIADAITNAGGGTMRIGRPSLAEPFLLFVAPAQAHWIWPVDQAPAAVVFITDPQAAATVDPTLLTQLFGLTATEAKVAASIAAGKGLPQTALALRISTNTAHTHLKRIFQKCGVSRQTELVRMLTRVGAVLGERRS
jgi:DNA-binding CsgD family transcriptional regulator